VALRARRDEAPLLRRPRSSGGRRESVPRRDSYLGAWGQIWLLPSLSAGRNL
jgi:hypothetical protein